MLGFESSRQGKKTIWLIEGGFRVLKNKKKENQSGSFCRSYLCWLFLFVQRMRMEGKQQVYWCPTSYQKCVLWGWLSIYLTNSWTGDQVRPAGRRCWCRVLEPPCCIKPSDPQGQKMWDKTVWGRTVATGCRQWLVTSTEVFQDFSH